MHYTSHHTTPGNRWFGHAYSPSVNGLSGKSLLHRNNSPVKQEKWTASWTPQGSRTTANTLNSSSRAHLRCTLFECWYKKERSSIDETTLYSTSTLKPVMEGLRICSCPLLCCWRGYKLSLGDCSVIGKRGIVRTGNKRQGLQMTDCPFLQASVWSVPGCSSPELPDGKDFQQQLLQQ